MIWICCALRVLCHCITAGPAGTGSHRGLFGNRFNYLAGINYRCLVKQSQGSVIGSTSPIPVTRLFEQLFSVISGGWRLVLCSDTGISVYSGCSSKGTKWVGRWVSEALTTVSYSGKSSTPPF